MVAVASPSHIMILLLLASFGGTSTNDLVSLIDARDYFQVRKIDVRADRLVELAAREPAGTKGQIQQLLAIRWLGEHPNEAKKAKAREALRQIADGEKAQGTLGFAQEYARRSLALLDGKPAPAPHTLPNNSLTRDALRWFPRDETLVGGMDLRARGGIQNADASRLRKLLAGMVPAAEKDRVYGYVEKLGNIRIDRYAFAMAIDPQQPGRLRMLTRYTGLADRQALARVITDAMKEGRANPRTVSVQTGRNDESVTLITTEKEEIALALVGNRDVLMAIAPPGQNAREVIEEALGVRAGKKASVLKGPFAERLRSVPANAFGLFVGDFSDKMRQEVMGRGSPFKVFPVRATAYLVGAGGVVLNVNATMPNADDARTMAESVAEWKKMAVAGLDQLPAPFKPTPEAAAVLKKALEGITVEVTEAHVKLRAEASQAALDTYRGLVEKALLVIYPASGPREVPPPGPPLPSEKDKAPAR